MIFTLNEEQCEQAGLKENTKVYVRTIHGLAEKVNQDDKYWQDYDKYWMSFETNVEKEGLFGKNINKVYVNVPNRYAIVDKGGKIIGMSTKDKGEADFLKKSGYKFDARNKAWVIA